MAAADFATLVTQLRRVQLAEQAIPTLTLTLILTLALTLTLALALTLTLAPTLTLC